MIIKIQNPRGYWVTIETLNCKKDMDATYCRVHALMELERTIAVEISKSDNPWKYFTIIHD